MCKAMRIACANSNANLPVVVVVEVVVVAALAVAVAQTKFILEREGEPTMNAPRKLELRR